ncbi:MAG: hypothetical protein WCW17_02580 [Patescibacteria group bacterium]
MNKNNYYNQYKYTFAVICLAIALSAGIFRNSTENGKVKGAYIGFNLFDNQYIDEKFAQIESLISATLKSPVNPTNDPLYSIEGRFLDTNNDGKKELVTRENWQGASGWSDKYSITALKGYKTEKIFDQYMSNSILFFEKDNIYQLEPYYQPDQPQSDVDILQVTIFNWQNNEFKPVGQELYPILNGEI